MDDAAAGASRRMSLSSQSQDVQAQLLPTGGALGDLRRVVILGDSLSDPVDERELQPALRVHLEAVVPASPPR